MTTAAAQDYIPLWRRRGVLPGYRLALGFTVLYLGLLVLLPLGALLLKASELSWGAFVQAVTGPRALAVPSRLSGVRPAPPASPPRRAPAAGPTRAATR